MAKILKPPIAQKPITQAGYFNQVWSRFFLGIETESEKVQSNNIQQSMTLTGLQSSIAEIKSQLIDGTILQTMTLTGLQNIVSDINTQITDIFIKLLFIESAQHNYASKAFNIQNQVESLETKILFSDINSSSAVSGPASALDNEVPIFDGTSGKVIKDGSGLIISDNLIQAENKALLLEGTAGETPTSGAGARMMYIPSKGAFRVGKVSGDQWDDANIGDFSFAGGYDCEVNAMVSAIVGGYNNRINSRFSGILGGNNNNIDSEYSGILGGRSNNIDSEYSGILGGRSNNIDSEYSGILGGYNNSITGLPPFENSSYCAIMTGYFNKIKESAMYSAIITGYKNELTSSYSAIIAGRENKVSGRSSAILQGEFNEVESGYSFAGGYNMKLASSASYSFVFGVSNSLVTLTQPNTFYLFPSGLAGQVAIGTTTPATSAVVDITSTTGALLLPRMTTAERDALTAINGMVIYNKSTNQFNFYENNSWVTK